MIKQVVISIATAIIILLGALPLAAQHHPIYHVKKVSDEISVSREVRVGTFILPAGQYRIDCDHTSLSFTNLSTGEKVTMPCLGKDMAESAETTELFIVMDGDGGYRLQKMYLKGSPVEHSFD